MNADGSGSFTLMGHPGATTPSWGTWSPDGSMIAFSSDVNAAPGEHDIYVMNKDGSGLTQLTTDPAFESGPAWSPDGTRLAFGRWVGPNDFEIFVVNLDGSGLQQLTDDPALSSGSPSWSPDGSKIVFWQTDIPGSMHGVDLLSVMEANGSDVTRINQPAPICDQGFNIGFPAWGDYGPKWAPDGSRILFQRRFVCTGNSDTDETHVFIMNTDGTDILDLTPGPEEATQPRWSPDGTKVIYRAGDWANGTYTFLGIWTMNPDGTAVTQISQDGSYPDWGP
jgi:TolB protein